MLKRWKIFLLNMLNQTQFNRPAENIKKSDNFELIIKHNDTQHYLGTFEKIIDNYNKDNTRIDTKTVVFSDGSIEINIPPPPNDYVSYLPMEIIGITKKGNKFFTETPVEKKKPRAEYVDPYELRRSVQTTFVPPYKSKTITAYFTTNPREDLDEFIKAIETAKQTDEGLSRY